MFHRGFTLIELLIVIVIIGTVASMTFPLVRTGMERRRVAGARVALTTMNAKARALAVRRSRQVNFIVANNEVRLESRDYFKSGVVDVIDRRDLYGAYRVTVKASRDTLKYDPRGLGLQGGSTVIVVAAPGGFADSVVITALGAIQ